MAALILRFGADVDAGRGTRWTALHFAAANGMLDAVEFLVANGANVQAKDGRGRTALSEAARFGRDDVAAVLANHAAR